MKTIILIAYLGMLSFFDIKTRKVPVVWLAAGVIIAALIVLAECLCNPAIWQWYVLRAVLGMIPGGILILAGYLSKKVGYGDGIALVGVGLLVGYRSSFMLLGFSLLIMSLYCMGVLLLRKGSGNTKVPYLPFLTVTYMAGLWV